MERYLNLLDCIFEEFSYILSRTFFFVKSDRILPAACFPAGEVRKFRLIGGDYLNEGLQEMFKMDRHR